MKTLIGPLLCSVTLGVLALFTNVWAQEKQAIHPVVQQVIAQSQEPSGVVFDIETLDNDALQQLLPFVRHQISVIRQRFPDIDVAVVSHGTEQFALQKNLTTANAPLQDAFNALVDDSGVSLHVCGAVASLKGLSQEDFADFVDVSASGLAQINDYKAIGYTVIPIKQLTDKERKALFEEPQNFLP
ncbi:MAG: DsrE family protein [Thiomicrorhabdus sp.]|nr:DsrE family protein [Thiomicrorhabdus sp.]